MKDNPWSERAFVSTGSGGTLLRPSFIQGWGWSKVKGGGVGWGASGLLSRSLRYVRKTFLKV